MLSYLEKNKKVVIPQNKSESDFDYLRERAIVMFDFKNRIACDVGFFFFIDIEKEDEKDDTLQHKDKLKLVVGLGGICRHNLGNNRSITF